jgi:hypothetical protein
MAFVITRAKGGYRTVPALVPVEVQRDPEHADCVIAGGHRLFNAGRPIYDDPEQLAAALIEREKLS